MNAAIPKSSYKCQANNVAGFTLIELMVTIAVMAIIVSIAAPSIGTQLANQRVKSTTATLANALKEAKAESIIRRQPITVSFINNSNNAGTINIANIANYSYNAKSTIKAKNTINETVATQITFESSKRANAIDFTICDNDTLATPRQVSITAVAIITSKTGGVCP